jgi:trk system potassium uptake protein
MRVLVAGGGKVGTFVAGELARSGHLVTVIEVDMDKVSQMQSAGDPPGVRWMVGDACEVSQLSVADPSGCDVVAALTGDDEDNLVISLLAKQEFGVGRVVARVNNPKNDWLFDETWGVDISVSTPHLLAGLVEDAVSVGHLMRLLAFDHDGARLIETTVATGSRALHATLAELALPREAKVVVIIRRNRLVLAHGDSTFEAGDEVLLLVVGDEPTAAVAPFGPE